MSFSTLKTVLFFLAALAAPAFAAEPFKSGVFDPPRAAPGFKLQGSNGNAVSLSDYKGKVVIVEFGFTSCPSICPVTMAKLSQVWKELGPQADNVQALFITVDPARDSPERLRQFVTSFNPSFIGLTGTDQELATVRDSYGVIAEKVASQNKLLGYEMHHSSSLHVVDRAGRLRILIPFGSPEADIVHDLKVLIAE